MHINLFGISGGKDSSALLLWALFKSGYTKESLRFTFCDTGNEHEYTYEHVDLLEKVSLENGGPKIEWLNPPLGFYDLAFKKKRFPSTKARFCTVKLKIEPTIEWVNARISEGHTILSHSGVRANESHDRASLSERDLNGNLLVEEYRPLLKWTIKDVYEIHKEYGVPLNKLYAAGARRVGCFPCIMSRKEEVRNIALNFPERIKLIAEWENKLLQSYGRYSSFFPSKTIPARFRTMDFTSKTGEVMKVATIADVVEWSMTGHRAKGRFDDPKPEDSQGTLPGLPEIDEPHTCQSGFCE